MTATSPITERRDPVARQSRDRLAAWLDMHPRELGCVPRSPALALDSLVHSAARAGATAPPSKPRLDALLELVRSLEQVTQAETAVGTAYRRLAEVRLRGIQDEQPRPARITVFLATIDGIDLVASRHGDDATQRLIDEVERRLQAWAAPGDNTVEHLGSNVFMIIAPNLPERMAPRVGAEIGAVATASPVSVKGQPIDLMLSIGSGSATIRRDAASIVAAADRAVLKASQHGGGRMVNTRLRPAQTEANGDITRRFGQNFRQLRIEAGITVEEVARRSGLHRTYIAGVESGHRHPTLKNIVKLAIGLGRSPAEVLESV